MNPQNTLQILRSLRFSAMADEYEKQLADPLAYEKLSFDERLSLLVDSERLKRQNNKLKKLIGTAAFSDSRACLEDVEYYPDRKLDKSQLWNFATCAYVDLGNHIILKGASGCGKTYLACALGMAACRKFKKVRYIRLPELLDDIKVAHSSGDFRKILSEYRKVDLLILDDWLLRKLNEDQAHDVLELVEYRSYNTKHPGGMSTIFCTQYNEGEWYDRIAQPDSENAPETDAILDRIVHNSHIIRIEGMSMRQRHGLDAPKGQAALLNEAFRGSAPNPGV